MIGSSGKSNLRGNYSVEVKEAVFQWPHAIARSGNEWDRILQQEGSFENLPTDSALVSPRRASNKASIL
jgi:hypothetical protein